MDVRCEKKEIKNYILPLVCCVLESKFVINGIEYNDVFGYYKLILESDKRIDFAGGIRLPARLSDCSCRPFAHHRRGNSSYSLGNCYAITKAVLGKK